MTYRLNTQLNGQPRHTPRAINALARATPRNGSTFPANRLRSLPKPFSKHQSEPLRSRFSLRCAIDAASNAVSTKSGNNAPTTAGCSNPLHWNDSGRRGSVTIPKGDETSIQVCDGKHKFTILSEGSGRESGFGLYNFAAHYRDGGSDPVSPPFGVAPAPNSRRVALPRLPWANKAGTDSIDVRERRGTTTRGAWVTGRDSVAFHACRTNYAEVRVRARGSAGPLSPVPLNYKPPRAGAERPGTHFEVRA